MDDQREKKLVTAYRKAKEDLTAKNKEAAEIKTKVLELEDELIELMINKDIKRTALYEEIGFVTLNKPKVRASCNEANKEALFAFLKEQNRTDMIKTSVGNLDKFVAGILAEGKEPPKFVSYYLQNNLTLTKK